MMHKRETVFLSDVEEAVLETVLRLGCETSLTQIHNSLGTHKISRTALGRYLYLLQKKGFIERYRVKGETWAKIKPEKIQQLRRKYGIKAPIMYLGLLGLPRPEYPEPETITAIKLLEKEGVKICKVAVASSREALDKHKSKINAFLAKKKVIIRYIEVQPDDYFKCKEELLKLINSNIIKHNIICDVTGGTKIMTLALAEVARKYDLPLIYVFLEKIRLIKL